MNIINFVPQYPSPTRTEEVLEFRASEESVRYLGKIDITNPEAVTIVKYDPRYLNFVKRQFFATATNRAYSALKNKTKPTRFFLWSSLRQSRNNFDHLLGIISSVWLYYYLNATSLSLQAFYKLYAFEKVEEYIRWLMGWPAGLKLNTNLDRFLGELFLWLLTSFRTNLHPISLLSYLVPAGIMLAFFLGLSPLLALSHDALLLLNVHFILFHRISSRLYQWQVRSLISLFHLFRGKKWNVLRSRMDSNDYDLDQLLLGTVLFTLLFFAFPTIVVYYVLFGLVKIMHVGAQSLLSLGIAILCALRDPLERTVSGYHFEPREGHLLLVIEESSPLSQYLRNVKRRIQVPTINLREILLGSRTTGTQKKR